MFPFKKKSNKIAHLLEKFKTSKKEKFLFNHAVHFLNISQFFGVVNDNVFKLLIVFLFIDLWGVEYSSSILFWAGTVYVTPFLLFSTSAGKLADRFSKHKLIVILKATEVGITLLGIWAFWCKTPWGLYSLLFLLSLQSAVFGPPKYSIIPELVKPGGISKANGLVTSFTYLAIIIGTFLASALTQFTDRNFVLSATICFFMAIIGFIASLCIPRTKPIRNKKKFTPFFLIEIYETMKSCKDKTFLRIAILGSAFFLFVGAFFQLNVIPFAIQSLGLSEVGGGYLFLTTAIGIAIGASVAGRASKEKIELGLSCVALCFLAVLTFILAIFNFSLVIVLAALVTIGFACGLFLVPLDSFIQTNSPEKQRGQIIAASNFLSFTGVLLAPFCLYFFGGVLQIKAWTGFFIIACVMLGVSMWMISYMPNIFFNYLTRLFTKPFVNLTISHFPFQIQKPLVVFSDDFTTARAVLFARYHSDIHIYRLKEKREFFDAFFRVFTSIRFLYTKGKPEEAIKKFFRIEAKHKRSHEILCLFLPDTKVIQDTIKKYEKTYSFLQSTMETTKLPKDRFKKSHISMVFS